MICQANDSHFFLKARCYIFFISDCPIVFEHDKDTFDTTLPEIDLMMSPVKIYKDPFRKGNHKIVLCQVLYPDGSPTRKYARMSQNIIGPCRDKTCLRGFRQSEFQTSSLSYRE